MFLSCRVCRVGGTLIELIALMRLIGVSRWITLPGEASQNQFNPKDQSDQCFHPAVYAV